MRPKPGVDPLELSCGCHHNLHDDDELTDGTGGPRLEVDIVFTTGKFITSARKMRSLMDLQWEPRDYECQYSSMVSDFRRGHITLTCQEIIRWTSIATSFFGFLLLSLDLYSLVGYPQLGRIWYPGGLLGLALTLSGLFGICATHQVFSLNYRHGWISITFLVTSLLSIVLSCCMIVGAAAFFPIVLDDRTDSLQAIKNTTITFYVLAFGFGAFESVFALRCVYAHQFERLMETQIVEISPLVIPKMEPILLASGDQEEDALFPASRPSRGSGRTTDVQTFITRNVPECAQDEQSDNTAQNSLRV